MNEKNYVDMNISEYSESDFLVPVDSSDDERHEPEFEYNIFITISQPANSEAIENIEIEFELFKSYFEDLPSLTQLAIFAYLKDDYQSLAMMRQVCSEWNHVLSTEPPFSVNFMSRDEFLRYVYLNIQQTRVISQSHMIYFRDNVKIYEGEYYDFISKITSLDMRFTKFLDRQFGLKMHFMLFICGPKLVELDLSGSDVSDQMIANVLEKCPKLESLKLRNTKIDGSCLFGITDETSIIEKLDLLLCKFINADFVAWLLTYYTKLTNFHVDELQMNLIKPLLEAKNKQLTSLQMKLNDHKSHLHVEEWGPHLPKLISLTELNLSRSVCNHRGCLNSIVAFALHSCLTLTVLNVNFCSAISDEAFCQKEVNAKLKELHIAGTNVTVKTFNTKCVSLLHTLNISECTELKENDVLSIVENFENLSTIGVNFPRSEKIIQITTSYLELILQCEERLFNLYGFVKADMLIAVFEFLRTKETSLGFNSIGHGNFRIHFKNMTE
jgi:hypothetical protein